jgi:molybdenum cofactor cytidylyltransferase
MPWIKPVTIAAIGDHAKPDRICVPQFDRRPGHPVAFGAQFFGLLSQCTGDRGARWVIEQHTEAVDSVPVNDPGILRDVDTPEALRQQ